MKYNYPQLMRKMCKMSDGCMRLEDPNFRGTNKCKYADEPIQKKENLGVQERLKL